MLQRSPRSGGKRLHSDSQQRMMRWKSHAVCVVQSAISYSQFVSVPVFSLCKSDELTGCGVLVLAEEIYTV